MKVNGSLKIGGSLESKSIACRGGSVSNLGLDLTSGVLKLVQANGSDCTALAPATVSMPSTTTGRQIDLLLEDALSLVEDASGTHNFGAGEFFGKIVNGGGWVNDMPLYLYAVNSDDTKSGLKFAFSPDPTRTNSPPTAARTGYHGNPTSGATDQSFFYLTSTNVTSSHINKPCMLIGSFIGTVNGSGQWTFNALSNQDGIGKYQEGILFNYSVGQMGAITGYTNNNSGSGIEFSVNKWKFTMSLDGYLDSWFELSNDGGVEAAANNAIAIYLPYKISSTVEGAAPLGEAIVNNSGITNEMCTIWKWTVGQDSRVYLWRPDVKDAVKDSTFANGDSRLIRGTLRTKIF